jgi:hypothetical protein
MEAKPAGGIHVARPARRFRVQVIHRSPEPSRVEADNGPGLRALSAPRFRGVLIRDKSGVVLSRSLPMPLRLVALNGGPDIPIDKAMIVVGRHPACDTRLDSILVSRRHCCMTVVSGELEVKDLGSTNGIRINGHRVETGRPAPATSCRSRTSTTNSTMARGRR